MLRVTVKGADDGIKEQIFPLNVEISAEEDVPADSLTFIVDGIIKKELCEVEVFKDENLIFSGVVDEQINLENTDGSFTEISARSFAAKLTDNEAYPMSLNAPVITDIVKHFVLPCGLQAAECEIKAYKGMFTVSKGTSCFNVLKAFCKEVYSSFPVVAGNVVYPEGLKIKEKDNPLVFGKDGISCESIKIANIYCNRITHIYAKVKETEGYNRVVKNGIYPVGSLSRVRFLNSVKGSSTPLSVAEDVFREAEKNSFYAEAKCMGCFADMLGKNAVIRTLQDEYTELYVTGVKYLMNHKGEFTKLTFKRKGIG